MTESDNDWPRNLVQDAAGISDILARTRRIAVLGIKTEAHAHAPAFYVPRFAQETGFEIVPVPVYYPEATEILGQQVYRRVSDIPGGIDLVNVFRRPADIPPHLDDIIAKRPSAVWFQLGIRNDSAAQRLAKEGIRVVQDRCLLVEIQARR